MKRPELDELYDTFDLFLSKYIAQKHSIIDKTNHILTPDYIAEVKSCFVNNYDDTKRSFEDKVRHQFANATEAAKLNFAHAEWLWCFSVGDIGTERKKQYLHRSTGIDPSAIDKSLFPQAFGHAGQWHTNNKYAEIVFSITLIETLDIFLKTNENTDLKILRDCVEEFCLHIKYGKPLNHLKASEAIINPLIGTTEKRYALSNILLYLCKPMVYERISSDTHKSRIVSAFSGIEDDIEDLTIDERILQIRQKIGALIADPNFDFYETKIIRQVWNATDDGLDFDELQALQLKKSIVLYGPPGTSKTHQAKELGKYFILNQYIRDNSRLKEYLENPDNIAIRRIHHLQFHANYTYENFIGGYLLKDGDTVLTPGIFLEICEKAKSDLHPSDKNKDIPHVLILDEINRIDISKLFGEVFSALEQRDHDIAIGVGNLKVNVPRNLYVIGTMNEIDFSLERIDFALRRRFMWFYYGFKVARLKEIVSHKSQNRNLDIPAEQLERFYQNVCKLNERISAIEELGEMYQVGHAFFADIVDIYHQYYTMKGYRWKKDVLFEKGGPAQILWNISICPILDSFLGDLDEAIKNNIIDGLKVKYMN